MTDILFILLYHKLIQIHMTVWIQGFNSCMLLREISALAEACSLRLLMFLKHSAWLYYTVPKEWKKKHHKSQMMNARSLYIYFFSIIATYL